MNISNQKEPNCYREIYSEDYKQSEIVNSLNQVCRQEIPIINETSEDQIVTVEVKVISTNVKDRFLDLHFAVPANSSIKIYQKIKQILDSQYEKKPLTGGYFIANDGGLSAYSFRISNLMTDFAQSNLRVFSDNAYFYINDEENDVLLAEIEMGHPTFYVETDRFYADPYYCKDKYSDKYYDDQISPGAKVIMDALAASQKAEKEINFSHPFAIPRKLHQIYFGCDLKGTKSGLPELFEECIQTFTPHYPKNKWDHSIWTLRSRWKKKDFEKLKAWCRNERIEVVDLEKKFAENPLWETIYPIILHALKYKLWALASDIARYFIVYEEGGVYSDMDCESFHSLDNMSIMQKQFFAGLETSTGAYALGNAFFGAKKGSPTLKRCLDYIKESFAQNLLLNKKLCKRSPLNEWTTLVMTGPLLFSAAFVNQKEKEESYNILPISRCYANSINQMNSIVRHNFAHTWLDRGEGDIVNQKWVSTGNKMLEMYTYLPVDQSAEGCLFALKKDRLSIKKNGHIQFIRC